jgi:hypothetical protein
MIQRLLFNLVVLVLLLAGGAVYAQDSDGGGNADSARDSDNAGNADSGGDKEKSEDAGKKIYKVRDEDGNVTFTDEPPEDRDSEEVQLQKSNNMRMESVPTPSLPEPEEEEKAISYELEVTSPANDGVLRHPTEPVPVKYSVKPAPKSGHQVQVLHNGEVVEGEALEWPIRGQHQVSVRVVDADGNVVSKSEPNTFFVHRPSKQLPYGP